ncbi:hypothetical protein QFW77_03300 [Luteimonas sp. RD2P54]|uniref:Uncharacterized protein n=1 Tax=Luteimonas endophytica TaxID=3042023 RepID=A0ABT6J5E0_9GAMM|nr:hypothetical protein [Luteimonas endophytica]MDH5822021.1 hypothetical protein [Luteimonas endophytica]
MFDSIGGLFSSAAQAIGGMIGGPIGAALGGMIADFAIQFVGDQLGQSLSNSSLPFDAQSLFSGNFLSAFTSAFRG